MKVTIGAHNIEIRGLTRGELRRLKEDGVDIQKVPEIEDVFKRDEEMMKVFEMIGVDTSSFDDLTPAQTMELFVKTGQLTFLGEDTVKNLYESQENGSEDGSTPAKSAKKKASRSKGGAQR